MRTLEDFRHIYCVDFEFSAPPGERPRPICLVATEYRSGRTIRWWEAELQRRRQAPYPTTPDSLFVAYYASAEIGCHLALDWPAPSSVLDLFCEFRNQTNGLRTPCGAGLVGALTYYGLDSIGAAEKGEMRQLAIRGGPWTDAERQALLDYCQSDVEALTRLLDTMAPQIDLERALLRGRYMTSAARIEHVGIPIDVPALHRIRSSWPDIQDTLIERIDQDYGVYDGRSFKSDRWAAWLAAHGIPWPRLPSGVLALDDDTFGEMARHYPEVGPIRELRKSLAKMRLSDLAVGSDGRNRCLLSAFRARTGRNQPSNARFIFGTAAWLRALIRPAPGYGVAYIDWSQQEWAIAAALSGDLAMCQAYTSGDPYLRFAQQAGAIPPAGTKATHSAVRDQFKACALAVQYGMGAASLATRIGQPIAQAQALLRLHRETYPTFWRWSQAAVDCAMLHGRLQTVFGWILHVGANGANPRSLCNFPMQANGAEMLRLACCLTTERGIQVCAPVHDALLIEAPLEELDHAVTLTQQGPAGAFEQGITVLNNSLFHRLL